MKPAEAWKETHSGASPDAYEITNAIALGASQPPAAGAVVTAAVSVITTSTSIDDLCLLTVENIGDANGTVAGGALEPGQKVAFAAPPGFRFASIAVNGVGTSLLCAASIY